MIEWNRVEELRAEIGPDGFADVLDLFFEEVEGVLETIGGDPAQLEHALHFLKGSAWNLGFATFGRLCQDGERAASLGAQAEIDLPAIIACYEVSKDEFRHLLQNRDAA